YRTAGVSALAAKYLARKESKCMALIGTGAQGEFQSLAFDAVFGLDSIRYYDIDQAAMEKYETNMMGFEIKLVPCGSVDEALDGADIITTATADKKRAVILKDSMLKDGVHVNGIGGDCPGKTELEQESVKRAKVVVEFLEQTEVEGEIQTLGSDAVYAELWEIVGGNKKGRESDSELTLFDSVGFAIEDYSVLNYVFRLATEFEIGTDMALIPEPDDPKNLFGIFKK
ncbi:MAG: ornithine cyclodeaminase, partial [Gammaproteobacteria bacterium]